MINKYDLTGSIIGKWTVLKRCGYTIYPNGLSRPAWLCECNEGHQQIITGTGLKGKIPKQCNKCKDLTGVVFGRLTVQKKVGINRHHGIMWLCVCECGNEVTASQNNLKTGHVQSCGCSRNDYVDLSGQVFGRLTVIERYNKKGFGVIRFLCKCSCGNEKIVTSSNLTKGSTNSCGCLRLELYHQKKAEKHHGWKGGRYKQPSGYVRIYMPDHPNARGQYVLEHVYVMSNYLGRPIIRGETVHHMNGKRDDNRIENLELWTSNHHPGQRVSDLISFAKEVLAIYQPQSLNNLELNLLF